MSNDDYMAELNQQELEEQQQLAEIYNEPHRMRCYHCEKYLGWIMTAQPPVVTCADCADGKHRVIHIGGQAQTTSPDNCVPRDTQMLWEREAQIHGGSRDD